MKRNKTLVYEWELDKEQVMIKVDAYCDNDRLAILIFNKQEGGEFDLFGDLTVNLPYEDTEPNEAFISDFDTKSKLQFIEKYRLGKVLDEVGYSGFCQYAKVAFDFEQLAKLDPEGVKRYKRIHNLPEKEPQKKDNRER